MAEFMFGDGTIKTTVPRDVEAAFDHYEEKQTFREMVDIKAKQEDMKVERVLRGDVGRQIEVDSHYLDL